MNERKQNQTQAASWVGDAIYGVNDGLGSIFGIVSGVSGATTGNSHFVLIAGLADMVARALFMGSNRASVEGVYAQCDEGHRGVCWILGGVNAIVFTGGDR